MVTYNGVNRLAMATGDTGGLREAEKRNLDETQDQPPVDHAYRGFSYQEEN